MNINLRTLGKLFIKSLFFPVFLFFGSTDVKAQEPGQVIDRIVAEVGANVIMQSELEMEYVQMRDKMGFQHDSIKCLILRQKIMDYVLLAKAQLDSVVVPEDRVDYELEKRIKYFASQFNGGEKAMEEYYSKTIAQIKADNRDKIKNSMIIQEMQGKALKDVKVSPTDIKKLFGAYTRDSLPFYSAEVELAQLVIEPKVSKESKQIALEKIQELRSRIVDGQDFTTLALIYSEDKGSAANGGELGFFSRGDMVPEFEAAAFRLKPDSISKIVETKYGYHILKLVDRKGERINIRHILIRPQIFKADVQKAKDLMDSILWEIKQGKLTFEDAAKKYSDDINTKSNGGFITESQTGNHRVPVDELDKEIYFHIEALNAGDMTEPELITVPGIDKIQAWRVFYLKSEMPPHRANLKDDYQRFQVMAQQEKQSKALKDYIERSRKEVFIKVVDDYKTCPEVAPLLKK
ncbi:MAG: peptidylprolyl isomerase [Bacteroidia bacterium]